MLGLEADTVPAATAQMRERRCVSSNAMGSGHAHSQRPGSNAAVSLPNHPAHPLCRGTTSRCAHRGLGRSYCFLLGNRKARWATSGDTLSSACWCVRDLPNTVSEMGFIQ